MKTYLLKVPEIEHRRLKVFAASNNFSLSQVLNYLIFAFNSSNLPTAKRAGLVARYLENKEKK